MIPNTREHLIVFVTSFGGLEMGQRERAGCRSGMSQDAVKQIVRPLSSLLLLLMLLLLLLPLYKL